jgi:hypothetical protein
VGENILDNEFKVDVNGTLGNSLRYLIGKISCKFQEGKPGISSEEL